MHAIACVANKAGRMLRQKAEIVSWFTATSDLAAISIAFCAAYLLRNTVLASYWGPIDSDEPYLHVRVLLLTLPVSAVTFRILGLYESFRLRSLVDEIRLITQAVAWTGLIDVLLIFALKFKYVSRLFLFTFFLLALIVVIALRMAARSVLRKVRKTGYNYRHILIVGTGSESRAITQAIEQNKHWGLNILGYVKDSESNGEVADNAVLGSVEDIPDIVQNKVVDGVIFTTRPERLSAMRGVFQFCRKVGTPLYYAPLFFDDLANQITLERIAGVDLIAFSTKGCQAHQLILKRGLDLILSSTLLALFAPGMLLAATLIRSTSRGPVLFKQKRVGVNGREFTLLKFRTMVVDAEQRKKGLVHLNEMDGPVFKIRSDPRTTSIGRVLRRTSLDELPQLFNVLQGQMSIVGPRPPLAEEVRQYKDWQRRRLSVKPGLTCLWQVSGRNQIQFEKWMELDLEYIDNWSWWLDLKIMARTVPALLRGQ